jgi:uncharacterized lipoprotein
MTFATRFLIVLLPLALAGCSYITPSSFKNRDREYLSARSIPPLKIPPGISSSAFHNSYPVSSRQYPRAVEDVSLLPPGLSDK